MRPCCLIVADDFTGSCDTGLQMVRAGLRARVVLAAGPVPQAAPVDVLVLDTETRNEPPAAAAARAAQVAAGLSPLAARLLYKKLDSTLRGPWAAELRALSAQLARPRCLVAPALPAAGRTTMRGTHRLRGVPVDQTEAGRDPRAPVRDADLPRVLAAAGFHTQVAAAGEAPGQIAARLEALPTPAALVCDAGTDADLAAVALAAARLAADPDGVLPAGSAGLAAHLPGAFGLRPGAGPAPAVSPAARVVVAAGSTSDVTRRQLAHLLTALPAFRVRVGPGAHAPERLAADALAGDPAAVPVLCLPDEALSAAAADAALRALALAARRIAELEPAVGFVATGGDTAVALTRAFEAKAVDIVGPVEDAVPACRIADGPCAGLGLVTKAGALGSDDALTRAVAHLRAPSGGR